MYYLHFEYLLPISFDPRYIVLEHQIWLLKISMNRKLADKTF